MRTRVGLLSVFLAGAACGGSSPTAYDGGTNSPPPPPPASSVVNVSMTDYAFAPANGTIKVGTTVKWTNNGSVTHTATSDTPGAWNSSDVGPSQPETTCPYPPCSGTTPPGTYSLTFTQAGTYPYHCTYHVTPQNMRGTITVTP